MTARDKQKSFDCVKSVREIRDRLSTRMARMSPEERVQWLNTREYSDPILRRFAAKPEEARSDNP